MVMTNCLILMTSNKDVFDNFIIRRYKWGLPRPHSPSLLGRTKHVLKFNASWHRISISKRNPEPDVLKFKRVKP